MEITIDHLKLIPDREDYSEYEEDDVVGVLSDACLSIDQKGIALFSTIFSKWDVRFNKVDFSYDFNSVASDLDSLLHFLGHKKSKFILHFYELDRRVELEFLKDRLVFQITQSIIDDVLFAGTLDSFDFEKKIEKVIESFKLIITKCFPQALEKFIKTGFLFGDVDWRQ
ncbi:hypothetical protein [Paraflavitalea speifideaquila]|uniref:hypothetical protein n=1 Tax=Paraflavitalea speifideaquila TaxID=3076558 RepID=UPI0028F167CF|nr:hypothetical protein [Paraflavitalea speifideiaquila]